MYNFLNTERQKGPKVSIKEVQSSGISMGKLYDVVECDCSSLDQLWQCPELFQHVLSSMDLLMKKAKRQDEATT